jgi:hypothetical protein
MTTDPREIAVVVRHTAYEGATPEQGISLMSWFRDPADADAEAERLNRVRRNEHVTYFVKILVDRQGEVPHAT